MTICHTCLENRTDFLRLNQSKNGKK